MQNREGDRRRLTRLCIAVLGVLRQGVSKAVLPPERCCGVRIHAFRSEMVDRIQGDYSPSLRGCLAPVTGQFLSPALPVSSATAGPLPLSWGKGPVGEQK